MWLHVQLQLLDYLHFTTDSININFKTNLYVATKQLGLYYNSKNELD